VDHVCDCEPTHLNSTRPGPTRRELLIGAAIAAPVIALAGAVGVDQPSGAAAAVDIVDVMPGLSIWPRESWAFGYPPKGPLYPESPQFLLVHHTASPNNYADPIAVMREAYRLHTGTSATKGWSDVAYEFFVGNDGQVWEGRTGSLAGPVMADATGGSQGFAQLVCLLGDFTSVMPTPAALDSLVKVLAWMGDRYGIDTAPGATTTFVSRGSNRFAAGTVVTTPTIAPHRAMSQTACPGDTFYPYVTGLAAAVEAQRAVWAPVLRRAKRLGRMQL
jgi:hypothetical protein